MTQPDDTTQGSIRHWPRAGELTAILLFWTFLAALAAAGRLLDPRVPGIQRQISVALASVAFFEYYVWALLTIPIFYFTSRYAVEKGAWIGRLIAFTVAGVVIAVLVDTAIAWIRAELLPFPRRRAFTFWTSLSLARLRFLDDLLLYFAVLAAGIARSFYQREQLRIEETVRLKSHTAHLQAQLAEARLAALRIQLNPHFLFNTLHAISALVERDPRGVRKMISRLSELLRRTLEGTEEAENTLAEEVDLLERYLDIMRIRYQGAVTVDVEIEQECWNALVPTLILQPLVENAFKHGVSRLESGGAIRIKGWRMGDRLQLAVEDNGGLAVDPASEAENGTGIGLENTAARLRELYGEEARMSLRQHPDGRTIARVDLPFRREGDA